MLDDRALTANRASRDIDRVPALKLAPPRVTWASRWGVIDVLQIVEAVMVATTSCFCLAVILANGGRDPKIAELLASGLAVAALVHSGSRSAGSHEFVDILRLWHSCKSAAVAWVLFTGPLFLVTAPFSRMIILGWLAGLAGIVYVRLAAALGSKAHIRARWLSKTSSSSAPVQRLSVARTWFPLTTAV
jgi:hypothetical protein